MRVPRVQEIRRLDIRILTTSAAAMFIVLFAAVAGAVGALAFVRNTSSKQMVFPLLLTVGAFVVWLLVGRFIRTDGLSASTIEDSTTLGLRIPPVFGVTAVAIEIASSPTEIGMLDIAFVAGTTIALLASRRLGRWLATTGLLMRALDILIDRDKTVLDDVPTVHKALRTMMPILIVAAVAAGLVFVLSSGPLGHDESVYALKARSWYSGTPATGWGPHRPPGLPAIGWLVLHVSDSEVALRSATIMISIGATLSMWLTGRIVFDRLTAALAVGVFVSANTFLRRATEFLSDLSAATLLMLTMLVIWYHFEKRPNGWWLVAAAPLGSLSFYMRYGSAVPLAVIAVMAILVWHASLRQSLRPIVMTGALLVVFAIPHVIYSLGETGSVTGVLTSAPTLGSFGLSTYAKWLPYSLAGPVGALLIAAAGSYTVYTAAARLWDRRRAAAEFRGAVFLFGTGLVVTVTLGTIAHAEARFLYLPLMAVLIVGARAAHKIWRLTARGPRFAFAAATGVLMLVIYVGSVAHMSGHLDDLSRTKSVLVDTANVIKADAAGEPCGIRSSFIPQLTWYTGCSTYGFGAPVPRQDRAYLVIYEIGKRQPTGPALDTEVAATEVELAFSPSLYGNIGSGRVFRYPSDS